MTIHPFYFHTNRGQENSMERCWFNSMLFKKGLERRCGLNKSMDSLGPIENTGEIEDSNRKDTTKNIQSWGGRDDSRYSNVDRLFGVKDIRDVDPFCFNNFVVKDSNGDCYSIDFDIGSKIFEINNTGLVLNALEGCFWRCSYLHNESTSEDTSSNNDTQYSWNNHINSCIESFLQSEIRIDSSIVSDSDNCSASYTSRYICHVETRKIGEPEGWDWDEGWDLYHEIQDEKEACYHGEAEYWLPEMEVWYREMEGETEGSDGEIEDEMEDWYRETEGETEGGIRTHAQAQDSDLILEESSNDREDSLNDREDSSNDREDSSNNREESSNDNRPTDFSHLWVQCDNCYGLNYKKYFTEKMYICEHCEWHLKMNSSDRIDLSIDPDTWDPMDEDMFCIDPIEFHSEDDPYKDRIDSDQTKTGLPEAIQTGIGELNGIPVAVGVMDFEFIGGSMGAVVGEKITRLIEYATNKFLPLIIVCASGGARMQEGSVSLMQMAKISSALYDYQSKKKLFYISILASPTTGGVTASFGMLGDIIIAEPNAYIAFAGKRVIEETLNIIVPEGSQETEPLFEKGLFDLIVPRYFLKSVLTELFKLHAFFPLTKNSNQNKIER